MRGRSYAIFFVVVLAHVSMGIGALPVADAAPKLSGYALPWRAGRAHAIRGSWYNQSNHKGMERYALDWDLWYEPVLAAKAGRVLIAVRNERDPGPAVCFDKDKAEQNSEQRNGFGNFVVIDHGDGVQTLYAHLSKVRVHAGQQVRRGKTIGISGNTGKSCGPHLHLRVTRRGIPIKPEPMDGYRTFANNHVRLYVAGRSSWTKPKARAVSARGPKRRTVKPVRRAAVTREAMGANLALLGSISASAPTFTAGETVTLSYTAVAGDAGQDVGVFGVKLRTPDDQRLMLPCVEGEHHTLAPGATFSCTVARPMIEEGTYWVRPGWLDRQAQWNEPASLESASFRMHQPHLELVDPARVRSPNAPATGSALQVAFTTRNPTAIPIDISLIYVRVWSPDARVEDVECGKARDMTLTASKQFTCFAEFTPRTAGTYRFEPRWTDARGREHTTDLGVVQSLEIDGPTPNMKPAAYSPITGRM